MINRISFREILAWITLAIAFLLLSVSIAFAQTKSVNVEKEDGKVHIKISKTENGKTVNIDTTFAYTDEMELEKIIEKIGGENEEGFSDESTRIIRNKIIVEGNESKKRKQISIDFDIPDISSEKLRDCISNSYSYSYSHSHDEETDSLDDKNHAG